MAQLIKVQEAFGQQFDGSRTVISFSESEAEAGRRLSEKYGYRIERFRGGYIMGLLYHGEIGNELILSEFRQTTERLGAKRGRGRGEIRSSFGYNGLLPLPCNN